MIATNRSLAEEIRIEIDIPLGSRPLADRLTLQRSVAIDRPVDLLHKDVL